MNKMRIGKNGKDVSNEENWSKMEKANGAIFERKFGFVKLDSRNLCWSS